MSNYPKKIRLVVYLTTGEEIQGKTITLNDDKDAARWGELLRAPKNMSYLALTQDDAFGDENSIYFNPTYITHIRVISIQE